MNPISYVLARRRHRRRMANLEYIERELAAQESLAIKAVIEAAGLDSNDASLVDHVTVLAREWKRESERALAMEAEHFRQEAKALRERERYERKVSGLEFDKSLSAARIGELERALDRSSSDADTLDKALSDVRYACGLAAQADTHAIIGAVQQLKEFWDRNFDSDDLKHEVMSGAED